MDNTTSTPAKPTNNKSFIWLTVAIVIAIFAAFLWWWNYRKYIKTNDANLDSFRINVAAQVLAPVVRLHVWEGDTVHKGMLLAELDSCDALARLQEAMARKEELTASLRLAQANLASASSSLKLAEMSTQQMQSGAETLRKQFTSGKISREALQQAEDNYQSARIKAEIAHNQITAAQAQVSSGEAMIASAEAAIHSAQTELDYYHIIAPSDGVIAKRWTLPGDVVQPGQNLFTLNAGKDIWVSVYLEETKFQRIHLGQETEFTLDAYKDLTFYGKIFYIGSNTASEFSLIPPNNASGNYTKVAQRIPLKISIDRMEGHTSDTVKLISGMSATVRIIKSSR